MKAAPAAPAQLEAESPPPPNRTGLPDGLKTGIESLSGMAMDHVQVHYNSAQPAQLNALAYAQGRDIHLAPGQERHLPHEAWHVVQQAQGRVRRTMQIKDGVTVNGDEGLEHEADVMGARTAAGGVGSAWGPNAPPDHYAHELTRKAVLPGHVVAGQESKVASIPSVASSLQARVIQKKVTYGKMAQNESQRLTLP